MLGWNKILIALFLLFGYDSVGARTIYYNTPQANKSVLFSDPCLKRDGDPTCYLKFYNLEREFEFGYSNTPIKFKVLSFPDSPVMFRLKKLLHLE